MAGRMALGTRARPTATLVLPREPGVLEALFIILMLIGKITFWIPVPIINMNLTPVAFVLLMLTYVSMSFRSDDLAVTLRRSHLFAIGGALVLALLLLAYAVKQTPYYGFGRITAVIEIFLAAYAAAMIFSRKGRPGFRVLAAWAGPIIVGYFGFMLLVAHGFSPAAVIDTIFSSIRTGDPNRFTFNLTEAVVVGTSELERNEFGRNVRHGWSGALLMGLLMSIVYARHRGAAAPARSLWLMLVGANVLVLLMLMSRGVLVGAATGILVSLLLPGRGRGVQIAVMVGGAIGLALILLISGLGELLYYQFFANVNSYKGRLSGIEHSLQDINAAVLFGIDAPPGSRLSAHNWVIDLWRGTGVFGAIGGILMLAYFAVEIVRLIILPPKVLREELYSRVLAIALVTTGAYVCIRFLTSGYGIIGSQEALAAGMFIALTHRLETPVEREGGDDDDVPGSPRLLAARWMKTELPTDRHGALSHRSRRSTTC